MWNNVYTDYWIGERWLPCVLHQWIDDTSKPRGKAYIYPDWRSDTVWTRRYRGSPDSFLKDWPVYIHNRLCHFFNTEAQIAQTPDKVLLMLFGVGSKSLRYIRERIPYAASPLEREPILKEEESEEVVV